MSKMPVKQGKSKIKKLKGKIIFVLCLLLVAAALIAGLVIIKNANDKETIAVAIKKVDQACAKGLLHKNNAARKKSQLANKLNSL